MDQKLVIETLTNIARLMELAGENVFKTRAFANGARALRKLEEKEFKDLVKEGKLREIPGIGAGLEEAILAILETGTTADYEKMKEKIPAGLLDFFKIPGLGAKRILRLYEALEVTNLGELEYACRENRLLIIPGFGKKRQKEVLRGIETLKKYQDSYLYPEALAEAAALIEKLREINKEGRQKITGALRRKLEVVEKIEILISGLSQEDFLKQESLGLEDVKSKEGKVTARSENGIPVTFHFTKEELWGIGLLKTTGSSSHLKLISEGGKLPAARSETEIYAKLGFDFIPPELREGLYETSAKTDLAALITLEDITGVFHNHSKYSDGINTLEEIAAHGKSLGYSYIGIADHSQAAYYANGLDEEELLAQMAEIDRINGENDDFTLLKGLEVDILADGSLDCADAVLEKLDYVIASVHTSFKMPKEQMTERILKALANKHLTMLGHPTGRLLLAREPYAVDLEAIIEAARKHQVILEINANPMRLDLDWRWARRAYEAGVLLSISPDAHRLSGYDFTEYGVNVARKAGLPKEAVINTRSLKEILDLFKKRA